MFAIKVFAKIIGMRLKGIKFDVISVHWAPEALITIFLKLFFRTPNVFVFEGYTKHEAKVAKFADLQIAISRDTVKKCYSDGYTPVLIPVGIDTSKYKVSGEATRRKLCNDDEKLVLTICRLDPRKDILTLVSAAKIVKEKDSRVKFVIVGEGSERGKIEEKIKELNLYENVKIERVAPASPEYFRAGDIFVLPSLYEGFGIVFLEAMSSELPIISTTAGAIPEVVQDAGILVPPGNPEKLADKILQLANDDELRRKLKEKGLYIAKKYDWDTLIIKYEKAYESVIKNRRQKTSLPTIVSEYEKIHAHMKLAERQEYYDAVSFFAYGRLTLDVACGDGWIEQRNPNVIGIDFSRNSLKSAKENGALFLIRADAHRLPFRDDSFETSICLGSLEHFLIPSLAMKELHRVLKTGGFLVLTVDAEHLPLFEFILKLKRASFQPIERKMKKSDILKLLGNAGFEALFVGRYIGAEKPIDHYIQFLGFASNYLPKVKWYHHFFIAVVKKG